MLNYFNNLRTAVEQFSPSPMNEPNRVLSGMFRPSEWVLIAYFSYTALLSLQYPLPDKQKAIGFAVPLLLLLLGYLDSGYARRWTSMVRDWVPAPMVLAAYWQVDWFRVDYHLEDLERVWLSWDRFLLNDIGLRAFVESMGPVIPSLVEIAYLLMYIVLPFSIAAFYLLRKRERVELFLFPFLLGTLSAYALISHFPSGSPRVEYPGLDMPNINTIWRQFNIWILNRGDIQTSVFPSGHVTAAFSAAFGMILALPERPLFGRVLLINAFLILVATVYGRYHYAVDGLAGLVISCSALGVTLFLRRANSNRTEAATAETAVTFPEAS